jgi:hypothetical protein
MLAALILILCAQDEEYIPKKDKGPFADPVRQCRAAGELLESDPALAREKLDAIIANTKVAEKVERVLKIEEAGGDVGKWEFFPYQYRGRAFMKLAQKESSSAVAHLTQAVKDLEFSFTTRKLGSSRPYLDEARAALVKAKPADAPPVKPPPDPVKVDPLVKLRPEFDRLVGLKRFRSAVDYLDKEGKELKEEDRKALAADAEKRCRTYLGDQIEEFRQRLKRIQTLNDLKEMTDRGFEALFDLPAPDELVAKDQAYEWARASQPAFKEVQARRANGWTLLDAAAAAVAAAPEGANPWFDLAEALAYESLVDSVRAAVKGSLDAAKADRDKARGTADQLLKRYEAFRGKLDRKFADAHATVGAHASELARAAEGFPVDLAELDKVDLDACFGAAAPGAELVRIEEQLKALEQGGKPITKESRQRLYTALVTVSALRALLQGKSEDEAAQAAGAWAAKLRSAGGPLDAARYGVRVEAVFKRLG